MFSQSQLKNFVVILTYSRVVHTISTDRYLTFQLSFKPYFSSCLHFWYIPIRHIFLVFAHKTKHLNHFTHSQCLIDQYTSLHTQYQLPKILQDTLSSSFYDLQILFLTPPFLISKQTVNRFFGTFLDVHILVYAINTLF